MEINLAIERTIKYAKKHGASLNRNEVGERLISKNVFSKDTILENLKIMVDKGIDNKFFLIKIRKAVDIARKIKFKFGDILFLGVSGSVASGHPKKDDDIDFLVITKKNKLWRTRLFLRWWIFKNKIPHRKYGEKEKKDQFCFNFWLDESSLLLPKSKITLENSVDLVLLKPLMNKENIYEKFIKTNNWAKKWVATPYENKISNFQPACRAGRFLISKKNEKSDKLNEIINRMYFWPQYWYMKRKINGEQISLHTAFFHRPMVK